jgi:hypothetical protein
MKSDKTKAPETPELCFFQLFVLIQAFFALATSVAAVTTPAML